MGQLILGLNNANILLDCHKIFTGAGKIGKLMSFFDDYSVSFLAASQPQPFKFDKILLKYNNKVIFC